MDRSEILKLADSLITEDRAKVYGDAKRMHQTIAKLWGGILNRQIEPHEVALCMAALKIARLTHAPYHEDSWVDAAAYIALGGELST